MNLGLDGARILVGGASRGIGLAIARELLLEGADVALVARSRETLDTARATLAGEFPARKLGAITADLRDASDSARCVAEAVDVLGGLDVVVANAGSGRGSPGPHVDPEEWAALVGENLYSAVFLCQEAARAMSDGGAICMVGSIAGLTTLPAPLPYSVAKAALLRYTKNLAAELAPRRIRVNMVAPGNVLFPGGRWEERLAADRAAVEAYIAAEVPLGRFATPEEVAGAVAFLCSGRAAFITGACLPVDGGQLGD